MSLFNASGFFVPIDVFRRGLHAGADPNEIWRSGSGLAYNMRLPLHEAARHPNGVPFLRALIDDRRTNTAAVDLEERTALHVASANGNVEAVRWLLFAGVELDVHDCYGYTPLHYACQAVDERILGLLLTAGAHPNVLNQAGRAPLHEALMAYTTWPKPIEDKVRLLLAHGAVVNQRDSHQMTPLYMAASAGWDRLVSMLLASGASTQLRAENGERPVDAVVRQLSMPGCRNYLSLQAACELLLAHDREALTLCVAGATRQGVGLRRAM